MSGCTFGNAFALSSLVIVSESGKLLRAVTALPSLKASREIFMLPPADIHGSCHRHQEKSAGQSLRKGGEVLISLGKMVPPARFQRATFRLGVGFTRFCFQQLRKSLTNMHVHALHSAWCAQFVKNCGTTAGHCGTNLDQAYPYSR